MTDHAARARRLGRPALVVIAATLIVGVAVIVRLVAAEDPDGPLQPNAVTTVTLPVAQGQVITWGSDLPQNETTADVVIKSVELVDASGVTVLGMSMIRPDVAGGIGTAAGYPPSGVTTMTVAGAVLTPPGGESPFLEVLTGVQLAPGSSHGTIAALRVEYTTAGRDYVVVLTQSLTLTEAPS